MAIITISRGCFSHGKDIAEKISEILEYKCISREVIIDASHFFKVSEKKLFKSLHDAPGLMDKFTQGQEEYLSYITAALLKEIRKDNVVYHGYGGHFLLPDVSNILKVRIISDIKTRIAYTMEKEKTTYQKAADIIETEDAQRKAWTSSLFGKNIVDPEMYDLVLNIGNISMDDAAKIICDLATSESFAATEKSANYLNDYSIQAYAKALLYKITKADVKVSDGRVKVSVPPKRIKKTSHINPELLKTIWSSEQEEINRKITKELSGIKGVKEVECFFEDPMVH